MKISIGITTYNRLSFLQNCLSSILNQDYEDVEIIIGNDYVNEQLSLEKLGLSDERIRILNHPRNLGEIDNLNNLLSQATGDYFIWLADDDEIGAGALNIFSQAINSKSESDFIIPKTVTGKRFPDGTEKWSGLIDSFGQKEFLMNYICGNIQLQGVYILYKTDFLKGLGGIRKLGNSMYYADVFLALRAISTCDYINYIDYPLVLFRNHESSLSNNTEENFKMLSAQIELVSELKKMNWGRGVSSGFITTLLLRNWFIRNFIDVTLRGRGTSYKIWVDYFKVVWKQGQHSSASLFNIVVFYLTSFSMAYLNEFKSFVRGAICFDAFNSKQKIYFQLELAFVKMISFFKSKKYHGIVFLKMDGIGDYLLFRNFIQELKKSEKYSTTSVTLVGNIAWRDLAEQYDSSVLDSFIWIDRRKIWSNKVYRFQMLFKLASIRSEMLIVPTYSRELHFCDSLARVIKSKKKITQLGDTRNMRKDQKPFADSFFDILVDSSDIVTFEFIRNRDFFSKILNKNLSTSLCLEVEKKIGCTRENRIVLFLGGGAAFRRWSPDNFLKLSERLISHFNCHVVICGQESEITDTFIKKINQCKDIINMVGKTRELSDLAKIISNAVFVVSNETSVPHMAVALGVPVFVISNVYGRFSPYPISITRKYWPIYHQEIKSSQASSNERYYKFQEDSGLDINDIGFEQVFQEIVKLNPV